MIRDPWVDPRIQQVKQVTLTQIKQYVLDHGFTLREDSPEERLLFSGPPDDTGNPLVLMLPASEQWLDFHQSVEIVIGSLAKLEDRYAGDVLMDVLALEKDPHTSNGTETATGTAHQKS